MDRVGYLLFYGSFHGIFDDLIGVFMTTDTMREKFEAWHFQKYGSKPPSGIDKWMYQKLQLQYAYEQGQRDLIEAITKDGPRSVLISGPHFDGDLEEQILLYELPEVTQK